MEGNKIKIRLDTRDKIKRFYENAISFSSDIDIMTDSKILDAKSIICLYNLDLSKDTYVKIISNNIKECKEFETAMEAFK